MTALARRAFDHRADLLAALVYGCLAYLSFNALADYANAHTITNGGGHLFPHPQGGWAFAIAIDGAVLYAFISFKRAPWLAGTLLVSGAASTYTLQRWHAQGALHPLWVAGVVPALMVLVTFAWHQIRKTRPGDAPVIGEAQASPGRSAPVQTRPRVAQDALRGEGPVALGRPVSQPSQRNGTRNGTAQLSKADLQALDRARKDPAKVERTVARRGLDRSLVEARPERWPLPERNGAKVSAS